MDPSVLISFQSLHLQPLSYGASPTHVEVASLRLQWDQPILYHTCAPFQNERSVSTGAASFVPVMGSSPCHSAGKCLSTKAIFKPGLKALRATELEGALEPQAEWLFYTINSAKAQKVRNASSAWLVDGWFFLRIVLPPNSSLCLLPPLGSCPPSGHLGDAWSLWTRGLGNNLSKKNKQI